MIEELAEEIEKAIIPPMLEKAILARIKTVTSHI